MACWMWRKFVATRQKHSTRMGTFDVTMTKQRNGWMVARQKGSELANPSPRSHSCCCCCCCWCFFCSCRPLIVCFSSSYSFSFYLMHLHYNGRVNLANWINDMKSFYWCVRIHILLLTYVLYYYNNTFASIKCYQTVFRWFFIGIRLKGCTKNPTIDFVLGIQRKTIHMTMNLLNAGLLPSHKKLHWIYLRSFWNWIGLCSFVICHWCAPLSIRLPLPLLFSFFGRTNILRSHVFQMDQNC